jgi:phosphatidylglycerophosphate synthase
MMFAVASTESLISLSTAIALTIYFVGGFILFTIRAVLYGVPRDPETEVRGGSILVGAYLRHYFFWLMDPLLRFMARANIPPMLLTLASMVLGGATGFAAAGGHFSLAGWAFLISGALDALDGRLARMQRTATALGAALDSILDRYTDCFVLMGLGWHYRRSWALAFVLAAFVGCSLVPYVRARGEGLGIHIRNGLMQRLERVLILGSAMALSIFFDQGLVTYAVVVLACTSNVTAVSRLVALMRALRGSPVIEAEPRVPHAS